MRKETIKLTRMNSTYPSIGIIEVQVYEIASEDISEVDALVFHTDGVSETVDRGSNKFGL